MDYEWRSYKLCYKSVDGRIRCDRAERQRDDEGEISLEYSEAEHSKPVIDTNGRRKRDRDSR